MSTNPARRTWRNRLLLIGLLPLVLAVLFAGKVGLMLSAQAAGDDAFGKDDFAKAAREFAGNGSLNVMEPWIASFNEGAARHQDEDYQGALSSYDAALEDVPDDEECTVRINMALAHEALGDAALEAGGSGEASADGTADGVAFSSGAAPDEGSDSGSDEGAEDEPAEDPIKQWQAGRDVLAAGDCPTDSGRGDDQTKDAAAVDERLRQKIEQQKQKQEQDPQEKKKQEKQEQQKKEKQKQQKQKLDKRNEKGRAQRQKTRDLEDYQYGDSEPGYEW
ncbi:hypothetical protein [Nocardioides jensenii]|uniref:hypothetical protein n=1 Tax=Nocardioides jensenii TaxID=1843 RepID=UPI00082A0763|nr:hypothetical protein [Nocardioides jensenii]